MESVCTYLHCTLNGYNSLEAVPRGYPMTKVSSHFPSIKLNEYCYDCCYALYAKMDLSNCIA